MVATTTEATLPPKAAPETVPESMQTAQPEQQEEPKSLTDALRQGTEAAASQEPQQAQDTATPEAPSNDKALSGGDNDTDPDALAAGLEQHIANAGAYAKAMVRESPVLVMVVAQKDTGKQAELAGWVAGMVEGLAVWSKDLQAMTPGIKGAAMWLGSLLLAGALDVAATYVHLLTYLKATDFAVLKEEALAKTLTEAQEAAQKSYQTLRDVMQERLQEPGVYSGLKLQLNPRAFALGDTPHV